MTRCKMLLETTMPSLTLLLVLVNSAPILWNRFRRSILNKAVNLMMNESEGGVYLRSFPKDCNTCLFHPAITQKINLYLLKANRAVLKYENLIKVVEECNYKKCYTFKQKMVGADEDNYERLVTLIRSVKYLSAGLPKLEKVELLSDFLTNKTQHAYECSYGQEPETEPDFSDNALSIKMADSCCEETIIRSYSFNRQLAVVLRRAYGIYQGEFLENGC